jgi:hypothetical protein
MRPTVERRVLVLVRKEDGALFWRAPSPPVETSDAPGVPSSPITASDAVALVKTEQKAVPRPGPITLRGQWCGTLTCDGGAPRVELVRKHAACRAEDASRYANPLTATPTADSTMPAMGNNQFWSQDRSTEPP